MFVGKCLVSAVLLVGLAGVPAQAKQLQSTAAVLLESGRRLAEAGQYEAAAQKMAAALALEPDDGRLMSEYGWVLFHVKRFDRAEQIIRAAIPLVTEPSVAGAAWSNLGQVYEAQGKPKRAVGAYTASLEVRADPTVERRLVRLKSSEAWVGGIQAVAAALNPLESFNQRERILATKLAILRASPQTQRVGLSGVFTPENPNF